MAGARFYIRRLKHISSTPTLQLVAICLFIFACLRWVIQYNHNENEPVPLSAKPIASVDDEGIDWSKFYYVQYATTPEYLCNALMAWSEIEEIGSRAQRLMMYPSHWDPNEIDELDPAMGLTPIARLLQQAVSNYYVLLSPIDVLHQNHTLQPTWADSYTKLLAFNLTSYNRILALDSDSVVLKNMDELFLLPSAPLAMPYVYWGGAEGWAYSSQMLLIEPSTSAFLEIQTAIQNAKPDEYDMDILTKLYKSKILHIPQRPYNLLSGEFRRPNHAAYLSQRRHEEIWDPEVILSEAKFLHFSDWPVPKPWIRAKKEVLNKYMPRCSRREWFGATDCRDRQVWSKLYYDFAVRRKEVCGMGFELQSQELPIDSAYRNGKWFHPDETE